MLNSIRTSVKDTLVYGLGNIAVKVIGLVLIPLYTDPQYFSVDEFGVLGILEISGLVLTAILASGLPQSFTRWFWDKEHVGNQKGIFFMSLSTQLIVSAFFCLLLIPLSGTFSDLLFNTISWSRVITLVILASAIQTINNLINILLRLQSKSVLYTLTNLLKLMVVLSLTLYFILSKKMGLEGIYLAQVIGNVFFILILSVYTVRNTKLFFDKHIFKSMNVYGFPLLLANLAAVLLNVIDRYSLNSLTLLKYVALYTLAYKITSVLKLVISDSIKLAIAPMMMKRIDSANNKRFYSKVLLYSSYVMMLGVIAVSMFSYEVLKVLAKSGEFWSAVVIIPVLALSVFFVNMKDITVYGLHFAKKTGIIGIIVVLATALSLILNILLIPVWDIKGAAVATLLSQFFYWLACYYFAQRAFFIPYETGKLALLFIVGAIFSFLSLLLNDMDLLPRLLIKTGCLISFPFILYLFSFYEPVELKAIRGFAVKWSDLKKFRENLNSLKGIKDEA
ncbi:MAG: oligosaccharide flippase family protein [Bacteroidales bacterium]|nr:oligosaccharide flippase family protein [Bacteroidales bacterium]